MPAQNDVNRYRAALPGPLTGLTVLELGRFASAPSCATLLADWGARLDRAGVTWAPVRTLRDTLNDDQIRASSALRTIRRRAGGDYQAINSPVTFAGSGPAAGWEAPLAGEHTELVLSELGYTATEIAAIVNPADDHPSAATVETL